MKKTKLLLAFIFAFACIACSEDDDKAPSFSKTAFIGTWEQNDLEFNGCTRVIKLDETKYYVGEKCGTAVDFGMGYDYTFDGKQTISVTYGGTNSPVDKYEIQSLTSTSMKVKAIYAQQTETPIITYTKL